MKETEATKSTFVRANVLAQSTALEPRPIDGSMNQSSYLERADASNPDFSGGAKAPPADSFVEPRATDPGAQGVPGFVEPTPDPLSLMAVDANELIGRMHAGEGWDVNALVKKSLHDRRAA